MICGVSRHVPADVWSVVLLAAYEDSPNPEFHPSTGWTCPQSAVANRFTQVCHLWRDIVIGTSSFWTSLSFDNRCPQPLKRFESSLERSRVRGIQVLISLIHVPNQTSACTLADVLIMVKPHMHRITALRMFADYCLPRVQRTFLEVDNLEELREYLQVCRRLDLATRNRRRQELDLKSGLPLTRLTLLEVEGVHFKSVFDILLLLRRCNALTTLRIFGTPEPLPPLQIPVESTPPASPALTLSSLRTASIEYTTLLGCWVETKALSDLTMTTSFPSPPIRSHAPGIIPDYNCLQTYRFVGPFHGGFICTFISSSWSCLYLHLSKCDARIAVKRLLLVAPPQFPFMYAPNLELVTFTDCLIDDDSILRLLVRCRPYGPKDLRIEVRGCPETTERLGHELVSRGRGSWTP